MPIDHSDGAQAFEIRRILQASRARVFAAWTQKGLLEQWMCRDVAEHQAEYVELDVRVGGHYVIEIKVPEGIYRGRGRFREVRAPEKLVFTWSWEKVGPGGAEPQGHESVVSIELLDRGPATEIVLRHELLLTPAEGESSRQGWEGCLQVLARLLEAEGGER
jgi:uncharacterized protein YndB with AHSA1/START domain